MSTQEEIQQQQELLATHRRTLAHYLQQQAALGSAYAPPGIAHGIHEARAAIVRIKNTLRGWGVAVADLPGDEAPPAETPAPSAPAAPPATGDTIHAEGSQGFVNRPSGPVNQSFGGTVSNVTITGGTVHGPVTGANYGTVQHQSPAATPPASSGDYLARYEQGLHALLSRLGPDHPRYSDALIYEQRLREGLAQTRRYGDTREREAARAEVIDRLNELARATVGVSFNELCG